MNHITSIFRLLPVMLIMLLSISQALGSRYEQQYQHGCCAIGRCQHVYERERRQ
ncbi:hypothetical protein [Paenibacillus sp. N3.4]|uniref:hypothetical protein n=1 Tax=Paenibacillus sp. N3.4 TaxID=2603222 RepID=UPI00164F9FB7|nr:hypothetical protein [Paenibacillus sp. N3.4]